MFKRNGRRSLALNSPLTLVPGSVLRQVYVMVLRQIGAWVPNGPQHGVHEHQARLEDVEVHLVPKNRTKLIQGLHVVQINTRRAGGVFHKPVDASHEYQDHAYVDRDKC